MSHVLEDAQHLRGIYYKSDGTILRVWKLIGYSECSLETWPDHKSVKVAYEAEKISLETIKWIEESPAVLPDPDSKALGDPTVSWAAQFPEEIFLKDGRIIASLLQARKFLHTLPEVCGVHWEFAIDLLYAAVRDPEAIDVAPDSSSVA